MLPRDSRQFAACAGILMLLCQSGCGSSDTRLHGRWAPPDKAYALEFTPEGTIHVGGDVKQLRLFRFVRPLIVFEEFQLDPGDDLKITYQPAGAGRLAIDGDYSSLGEKLKGAGGPIGKAMVSQFHPHEAIAYVFDADGLTLTSEEGQEVHLRLSPDE